MKHTRLYTRQQGADEGSVLVAKSECVAVKWPECWVLVA